MSSIIRVIYIVCALIQIDGITRIAVKEKNQFNECKNSINTNIHIVLTFTISHRHTCSSE